MPQDTKKLFLWVNPILLLTFSFLEYIDCELNYSRVEGVKPLGCISVSSFQGLLISVRENYISFTANKFRTMHSTNNLPRLTLKKLSIFYHPIRPRRAYTVTNAKLGQIFDRISLRNSSCNWRENFFREHDSEIADKNSFWWRKRHFSVSFSKSIILIWIFLIKCRKIFLTFVQKYKFSLIINQKCWTIVRRIRFQKMS